jgi:hypothetical protein
VQTIVATGNNQKHVFGCRHTKEKENLMKCYENYSVLKEAEPKLAEELSHEFDFTNDPVEYEFYVYPSCVDWAENELNDGWYSDMFGDMNFRGAPNPLDFIDMEKFGQALIDTVDPSVAYECSDGRVVEVR